MNKLVFVLAAFVLFSCGEEKNETPKPGNPQQGPAQKKEAILPSEVRLGDYSFVEIGVKNTFEDSKKFYETMGFEEVPDQFEDENLMMMSDNSLKIVLNKGSIAPAMLIYLNKDIKALADEIKKQGILVDLADDFLEVKSPDGIKVTVLQLDSEGMYQTTAMNMMNMMQTNEIGNPASMPNKKMGIFGEFSHQVRDVESALRWWAKVGLIGSGIMEYGYKFAIIADKQSVIGVHEKQDDKWIGNAITYFATDQDARIAKLKNELDPSMIRESQKLGPGSAIVKSPEGNLIFVFKL
jgi:predicted lactoylglutathione lyase